MKDIHAMAPPRGSLRLRRVGVAGLKKPLVVARPEHLTTLTATFSVAVDLPSDRKGSDLSRNAQVLAEVVDQTSTHPVSGLEAACSVIAEVLLDRHPSARESAVHATAEYFLARGISEERRSLENYLLIADARAYRAEDGAVSVIRTIGVEAVGMTACPCAMEGCREQLTREFPLLADPSLAELPIVTHNQRNRTRLSIELPAGIEVEADEMISVVESAQSSPTYAILKRGDEAQLVLNAHRHPRFVEDVVRELLSHTGRQFPQLPDSAVVTAETRSEESIHKYDVEASHSATIGELRAGSSRP
ncbi:MAG: GTP cyclohydrolase MptA [Thermoplasmata archaeon]|nr:GTP cyclohydrolase MptA [Thermoplasmata archaeon]